MTEKKITRNLKNMGSSVGKIEHLPNKKRVLSLHPLFLEGRPFRRYKTIHEAQPNSLSF